MKRTQIAAAMLALLLGTAACGAQHTAADDNSVGISTAVSVTATDPTYSAQPLVYGADTSYSPVSCDMATDDLEDGEAQVTPWLAEACDYRVTGQPCQEDELCAVQQVRDTGDFKR